MSSEHEKKPNWQLIKEAAMELYNSGKVTFTRKQLVGLAHSKDPTRSEMSLDFEVDLVTVNSSSKDRYKDPDKLFLFRIDRGHYTLYDPETHGPLEKYVGLQRITVTRKDLVSQIARELEEKGYEVYEERSQKPLVPDLVASSGEKDVAVWIVDPGSDVSSQLRSLALAVGSSVLDVTYSEHLIIVPQDLLDRLSKDKKDLLSNMGVRLAALKEERRYTLIL
ncbi:MAG: hypothetical protein ABWK00_02175 [Desulfurococcaceae archaeon]